MILTEQWLWDTDVKHCESLLTFGDDMPIIAGYLRVSSDEQAREGYSIETQAEHIREECLQRFPAGCHLVFIADEGVSGILPIKRAGMRDGHYRLGLTLLSELVARGLVHAVGVYKCNRLARKLRIWLEFEEDYLEPQNVLFFSSAEGLDNRESGSGLVLKVLMSSAEYEREQIVSAGNDGKRQRKSEGYYLGEPPYGWQWQDKRFLGRHQRVNIEPVPEQAEVIHRIIAWYLDGRSPRWIARELTESGVPTHRGNSLWHKTAVRYILTDPTNAGLLRDGSGGLVHGLHYPSRIIEVSEYEAVQNHLRARREAERDTNRPDGLVFEDLLRCGICGGRMGISSQNNGSAPIYICRGRLAGKQHRAYRVRVAVVEARMERTLLRAAQNQKVLDAARGSIVREYEERQKTLVIREQTLQSKMKRAERNICVWAERSFAKDYSGSEVEAELERLGSQRKEIQIELDEVNKELKRHKSRQKKVELAASILKKIPKIWNSMDTDEKRALASRLVEEAVFEPQPGHIDLRIKLIPAGQETISFYVRGRSTQAPNDPVTIGPALLTAAYWLKKGLSTKDAARACGINAGSMVGCKSELKKITTTESIEEALEILGPIIDCREDELWLEGRPRPTKHSGASQNWTNRQKELLKLRQEGLTLSETARRMGIKLSGAGGTQKRIYRKLGVHCVKDAVRAAIEIGVIT